MVDAGRAGLDLLDAFEHRLRRDRRPEREQLIEPRRIQPARHVGPAGEDRLHLAREVEPAAMLCDVERTHAERISRQHQLRSRLIPERDRPLPVEAPEGALAPLLEGVDDDFGVAAGSEPMAEPLELVTQLDVVEDLAVEDDPQRAVLVRERLLAAGEVDDREPRVTRARHGDRDRPRTRPGPRCFNAPAIRRADRARAAAGRRAARRRQRCRTSGRNLRHRLDEHRTGVQILASCAASDRCP